MAVTFTDLMTAVPGDWERAADTWLGLARESEDAAAAILERGRSKVDEHWTDEVGAGAGARLDTLSTSYQTAAGTMHGVVSILYGLADAVGPVQRSLQAAVDFATGNGLSVDAGGGVVVPPGWAGPPNVPGDADRLIREAVDSAARIDVQARDQLDKLADAVTNEDRDAAIDDVQGEASASQVDLMVEALPVGQDPATVAAWWNSLSEEDRSAFEKAVPVELYDLQGLPEDVKRRLEGDGGYNRIESIRWAKENAFNPDIDIYGNNCANFVSHALLNGGLEERADPVDARNPLGHNWTDGAHTGIPLVDTHTASPAWYNSERQRDLFVAAGGGEIPLSEVQPGDIIYFEQAAPNGPIEEGKVHHAAVVTSVTPDGDIHYTQHTASRLDASLDGRLPTTEVVEGDQRVVAARPRQNW
ncbi:amidase domain-containing protein [Actinoplanes sp. NBRC 103695]|uniref:amidase domain-containing protein n=1 Tax=Actinoplanes sp. NBRC 103695 TaxID=3032202 RepID=UPI0024A4466B|nr:amidase domain-containing protein [Actinoplanes sp. NBRC 103695]GLY92793.1 hypothetical protein Acsp02_00490 [Actinoplanes sp. NBRC 103695]